jgi:predicted RND superfamily exporter protein
VPTLELNDEWVKYFDESLEFRQDAEFALDELTGLYLLEYSVTAGSAGGISEPAYLETLEAFTGWLRTQPEVRHVYSYSDIVKRLNKNMHGDNVAWHAIPDDRELAAQYLLLYELSLPYGLDLNDRISVDKSATRVTVTLDDVPTATVREFIGRSEAWMDANAPTEMHGQATGATVMFSYISERNINSMLGGNAIAVALIALIMMAALRSLPMGALSLIPNAIPILMTFGVWALLVGQVGLSSAMVSATSLGIVVDNTVHYLTKYLRARRQGGLNPGQAVIYAFETVGAAILANAAILAAGFSVLAFSTFRITGEMGSLTALAIVIALAVDFLLLPALLLIGHTTRKGTSNVQLSPVTQSV